MFCDDLEKSLNEANQYAIDFGHSFITIEHMLLALMDNPQTLTILNKVQANTENIRGNLTLYLEKQSKMSKTVVDNCQLEHSDSFKRVMQRAIFHAQTLGKTDIHGGYILAAILSESESQAFFILSQEGIHRTLIIDHLSENNNNLTILPQQEFEEKNFFEMPQEVIPASENSIENFAINLNEEVKRDNIDPLIGRDTEVARVEQILCRRRKNNPIIVGEPGVGKTAIVEGLAREIVEGRTHPKLANMTIYALDLGALLAGTKYRGDFEKRFKAVLKEFKKLKNATIFIDEIHTIIGAGAASGGAIDAANLLKPLLTKGDLRCIGATTYQEYKQLFEKDQALSRRFQKIDVKEASKEHTLQIIKGLKDKFEDHHCVKYSNEAIKTAIDLSSRYMAERFLPDKAIDIIDEAGAAKSLQKERKKNALVQVRDIEKVVASLTQIPQSHVTASDKKMIMNLERDLNMLIYGQNKAVERVCGAIKLSRSGLGDPNKPIGSFLFSGPTGVGKTELAKNLASILNLNLIRFDMSEYMEKHSSSQLVGAPAGYVGYEKGGLLTEAVMKNPYSILLLDEIEKAHQDLFNLLLQVLDYGTLTDNTGRTADFRNVIIIMTSNCGAQEACKNGIGFNPEQPSGQTSQAITRDFSPEFRNRLDAIISFNQLGKDNIAQIVDKFLTNFEVQLQSQGIELVVEQAVKDYLGEHGFDPKMGARPMARLINDKVKKPIADALLFGNLKQGETALVDLENDKIVMKRMCKSKKSA